MTTLATLPGALAQYRGRLAILLVLVAAVYFTTAFGEQAWRARQLQAEVNEQRAALAALDREHDQLQQQVDDYSTDAYFTYAAGRARRDLSLANPGETLLLVHWLPSSQPAPGAAAAPTSPAAEPNWHKWLDLFAR